MKKYRKYNWPRLFEEFTQSGLTQAQFCTEQKINTNYFNQKLSKHRSRIQSKFIAAGIESPEINAVDTNITIMVGRCKIQCPASMSLPSLSALVHSLV